MLLVALKHIPSTVSIAPGQTFVEQNPEQCAEWLRGGFARPAEMAAPAAPAIDRKGLPDWTGAKVVIIASGPSLTEEQCLDVGAWRSARDDGTRREQHGRKPRCYFWWLFRGQQLGYL